MKRVKIVICAAAAALLLTAGKGCSSGGGGAAPANPIDGESTCQQWLDASQANRDDAAQTFAEALKAFDTSATFAHQFAGNISTDCSAGPSLKLKEVAAALATLDTDDFPR